jgi:4-hydroxy-2-oxoheptanedioate aldolase
MRSSRIRAKLAQNQPVLVTALSFTDPAIFELTSLMGFDGIWLDLEHHAPSVETAQNLMRAARVGQSDIIARPAKGEFMRLGRLLEAGAQGIMYPRCECAEEAAEVVQWAKFPPLGKRGIDGGNPDMPYCSMPVSQYLAEANEQTFIIIQLEEQHVIDRAAEIAMVDGVDVLFLGPGDYSSLSGFPGQMDHPRILDAMQKIASAARRAGKHWGRPVSSIEQAQLCLDMGARFLAHNSDLVILKQGLENIQARFQPLGFEFDSCFPGAPKSSQPLAHRLSGPHRTSAPSLHTVQVNGDSTR